MFKMLLLVLAMSSAASGSVLRLDTDMEKADRSENRGYWFWRGGSQPMTIEVNMESPFDVSVEGLGYNYMGTSQRGRSGAG